MSTPRLDTGTRFVADYRFYFLNAEGRIIRVHEASCAEDAAAIAEARRLDHADVIEVWDRARRVAEVTPSRAP